MRLIEITATTPGWEQTMQQHLNAGERALVRFERPSMTPAQMADSVGISRTAIMRRIASGEIPTHRQGTRHRIDLADVERFRANYFSDLAAASADDF